jgi:hypothetical protein
MIEVKRIDANYWKTGRLLFRDDGPVNKGAKTRRYSVFDGTSRSLLGYIKWFSNWRQYCFFPLNSLFNKDCLRQVALFCEEATTDHMSRLPNINRAKRMEKARRVKKMERMAKMALTNKESSDTIDSVSETKVPSPENLVVEGFSQAETPLGYLLGEITIN